MSNEPWRDARLEPPADKALCWVVTIGERSRQSGEPWDEPTIASYVAAFAAFTAGDVWRFVEDWTQVKWLPIDVPQPPVGAQARGEAADREQGP